MDDFGKLNYRDLQKLAKTAGVKANLPKAELLQALRDHAANSSLLTDDEDPPITEAVSSGKKSRKSESKLNTTFDMESETEDKLNRTFDKEDETEKKGRRSSVRLPSADKSRRKSSNHLLSVTADHADQIVKETNNSPAPRRSSTREKLPENVNLMLSTPGSVKIGTPRRISEIQGRAQTPRTSGGKVVKLGKKSSTPKAVATPRRSLTSSSAKKPTPRRSVTSSTKKSTPRRSLTSSTKDSTPKPISSARKNTPRTGVKAGTPKTEKKTIPGTNIPRFVKFARKVPDFSKLHAKQFNKMESLDQFLDKKKKRVDNNLEEQRIQKAKLLGDEHQKLMEKMKSRTAFVPSVTSTSNLNFNFGGAKTAVGAAKAGAAGSSSISSPFKFSAAPSLVSQSMKKPERAQVDVKNATKSVASGKVRIMKPVVTSKTNSVQNKQNKNDQASAVKAKPTVTRTRNKATVEATPNNSVVNKSTMRTPAVNKSTIRTPATNKSTARTPGSVALSNITNKSINCVTPGSAKKQGFDLKASLAKPLGYKPHTGKLPSWGQKKKITEMRNVTTKDVVERTRNIIKGVRMNKRAALMLQNRNLDE